MIPLCFVKIPVNIDEKIETLSYERHSIEHGDQIPSIIQLQVHLESNTSIEAVPLKRMAPFNELYRRSGNFDAHAGLYIYVMSNVNENFLMPANANIRATSLAMACGLHSKRFYGDVYVGRLGYFPSVEDENVFQLSNCSLTANDIKFACYSPDLRLEILRRLNEVGSIETLPEWILDTAKCNYEDASALAILASVMKKQNDHEEVEGAEELPPIQECDIERESIVEQEEDIKSSEMEDRQSEIQANTGVGTLRKEFVAKSPLCLHCRKPTNELCDVCEGAYFHQECKPLGWSHRCVCKIWKIYTGRRNSLSTFPFSWHLSLTNRDCQISDHPYEDYLMNELKVLPCNDEGPINWWNTEQSGWKGGQSKSAERIDITQRLSYIHGFGLDASLIPQECQVTDEDCERSRVVRDPDSKIIKLQSWEQYYKLRSIPIESHVALLMTFPLTIHYAFSEFGEVPITVSRMLNRPMRVHVIGVEKELNFLDLFKEVGYLLPLDLKIELVFIIREDMKPHKCNHLLKNGSRGLKLDLTENLTLIVQAGTYNETLDPNFDCGSGPPDMIIALNAGLFAYESWRNVIGFLDSNKGVVGVFTDYNEHSGYNCASLGGKKSIESLSINPFRQPRAMPVYSMNLPQFSNGFIYVFNQQELD